MKKNKRSRGFTLIEAMVVLFIIGVLSFIGAVGFGKVTRQKMIQKAYSRISTGVSNARDYSIFGKQVNEKFPCGYGIAIDRSASEIKEVYTSGAGMDRVAAMNNDKSCDELIDNVQVDLSDSQLTEPENLSLENVITERTVHYQEGSQEDTNCLVILFSAPRGKSYYCFGAGTCPPPNCTPQAFFESGELNTDLFLTSLLLREGGSEDRGCISIYPSGNSQLVADVPNCFTETGSQPAPPGPSPNFNTNRFPPAPRNFNTNRFPPAPRNFNTNRFPPR